MDAALEFAGLLYEMAVTIYFEAHRTPAEEGIDDCSELVEHCSPISNRPFTLVCLAGCAARTTAGIGYHKRERSFHSYDLRKRPGD